MDSYVTGSTIKQSREAQSMTQADLAEQLGISSKAVSKWETGKGLPDISLLQPLANALQISVTELLSGDPVKNTNRSCNMLRSKFYVCPICGNVIHSTGESAISCCGIALPVCEAEEADDAHMPVIEVVEDEHYITIQHPMTKTHFISFVAFVTTDRIQMVKLYPEGDAQMRMQLRGRGLLYLYCNQHGLMKQRI